MVLVVYTKIKLVPVELQPTNLFGYPKKIIDTRMFESPFPVILKQYFVPYFIAGDISQLFQENTLSRSCRPH